MSEKTDNIYRMTTAGRTAMRPEALPDRRKEMLLVTMALTFIEQHALMTSEQLAEARRSLQALFIRSTGEETMLRKLIEILKVNKELHQAFSLVAKISISISTSVETIDRKIAYLKQYANRLDLNPQENSDFFAPFMAFSQNFANLIHEFNRRIVLYLTLREEEAKRTHGYRIAREASQRLRERLTGQLTLEPKGEDEESLKQEVLSSFDFAAAGEELKKAQRESRLEAKNIHNVLSELRAMCQMAMNPDMREAVQPGTGGAMSHDDVFRLFTRAVKYHPRLNQLRDFVVEYFRLYQRAYGMFALDFDNLNKAVETISGNTAEYFKAKIEDQDLRAKREKLRKYEGLIPFVEDAARLLVEFEDQAYGKFSKRLSEAVSVRPSLWEHITEELLVAKVAAEADLSTRLSL
jgi:hypothetical protein